MYAARPKEVLVKPSLPLSEQLIHQNTKYVIIGNIDLKGKTMSIPYASEIEIRMGKVSNGIIEGNHSYLTLKNGYLDRVSISKGVQSTSKIVNSSMFKTNTVDMLLSLCNLCPVGGTVKLDDGKTYTIKNSIKINKNISIIGGKKSVIKLKNPDNCAINVFNVIGTKTFSLKDITIDGSWDSKRGHGKYENQSLMDIVDVDTVIIKNCIFNDAMVINSNWREKEAGIINIRDYRYVQFDTNTITHCYVNEGVLIRNDNDKKGFASITNNVFDYEYTSSCMNAYYGRYSIKNNVFGTSRGSAINVFGYDSEIKGNTFWGSQYSCAIDLSENGFIDYPSHNITISGNICYFCYDGFINGCGIYNVDIKNNTYNGMVMKQPELLDRYDSENVKPKRARKTDKVLVLIGDLTDISIEGNVFKGGEALLYLEGDAQRKNISIVNNNIELDESTSRSTIVFNAIDGLRIKKNIFIGSGCTPGYLKRPVYIATLPVYESNRTVSNISIEDNQFYSKSDSCYIFTQSIYDRNMDINFLELKNINIVGNKSNVPASLVFVNKSFSDSIMSDITVRNNDFKGGCVMANTIVDTDLKQNYRKPFYKKQVRGEEYQINTIVERGGKRYYVVAGGKTSENAFVKKNDFIKNGAVVLREMK